MVRAALLMLTAVSLTGCNIVPPLDCLVGAQRSGCQRDANGEYHYLYTSPLLPAPNSDAAPVGFPAPQVIVVGAAAQPQFIPVAAPQVSAVQATPLALQPMIVPAPPPARPMGTPPAQQQDIAVSPQGTAMGVVMPMGGGNDVVVSPDGPAMGVTQ